jgi:hypothetical protein
VPADVAVGADTGSYGAKHRTCGAQIGTHPCARPYLQGAAMGSRMRATVGAACRDGRLRAQDLTCKAQVSCPKPERGYLHAASRGADRLGRTHAGTTTDCELDRPPAPPNPHPAPVHVHVHVSASREARPPNRSTALARPSQRRPTTIHRIAVPHKRAKNPRMKPDRPGHPSGPRPSAK